MTLLPAVPLDRRFSLILQDDNVTDTDEIGKPSSGWDAVGWADILEMYRCVILAGAGAGKTHEMRDQATRLNDSGLYAFFIRIEDLDESFQDAFEVGNSDRFCDWLDSKEDAWFFLDSVDEARLENPRTFERAIRRFASRIKNGQHRAHIIISSRPYAWRPRSDRLLMQQSLPWAVNAKEETGPALYHLTDLSEQDIRIFAAHRQVDQIDALIDNLFRADLMSFAGRPFDLEGILSKWRADASLGSRLDLLGHNVRDQLSEIDPDRAQRSPISPERALDGARRLAAAVILTGKPGVRVPDGVPSDKGIDARAVLADWNDTEIGTLLQRGLFSDPIYGMVRFRHREARELLAAEWLARLLSLGNARLDVEALLFRKQYEARIVIPKLRPVLPWLILMDAEIRRTALSLSPEIAIEGGDVSRLPLDERQKILRDVATRIASDIDDGSARWNEAIIRIATPDLADEAGHLIEAHPDNDDVLSFLGRLVWQGEMSACLPALERIALTSERGVYARIAAIRAVMTVGTSEQARAIWDKLLALENDLPVQLLAEVVDNAAANTGSVCRLIASMEKLPDQNRREVTGLGRSMRRFVDRLRTDDGALSELIAGTRALLDQPPFIEWRYCEVSKRYVRLLPAAARAVERLVEVKAASALSDDSLEILSKLAAARSWHYDDMDDPKTRLGELVPAWPALNDALFWYNVTNERAAQEEQGKSLADAPYILGDSYWRFTPDDLSRLTSNAATRERDDEALVAVFQAHRVIRQYDLAQQDIDVVREILSSRSVLCQRFDQLISAQLSKAEKRYNEQQEKRRLQRERKASVEAEYRKRWIHDLQADPDRIRDSAKASAGEFTNDRYWLFEAARSAEGERSKWAGAAWRNLEPEFGLEVAKAYRDAAIACWRAYRPPLLSEGHENSQSTPGILIFGLAGLEMEAAENASLFESLDEITFHHALRYMTWELNGFPTWLEAAFQARPALVMEAVRRELLWELTASQDAPLHHVLHDFVYHAPWMHAALVNPLLDYLTDAMPQRSEDLQHAIHILRSGGASAEQLVPIAQRILSGNPSTEKTALLLGLWIDLDAATGIPALEAWLAQLPPDQTSDAMQQGLLAIVGSRRRENSGPRTGNFQTVEHLTRLHRLAHAHVRREDDINRNGTGAYSPTRRDDAQDARDELFSRLADIPGKATYLALSELATDHPVVASRPWMRTLARRRAETDGDLELWSEQQFSDFHVNQTFVPGTDRQLFDIVVARLQDIRDWLENGDDSPYKTWQRVTSETEMRNLIAGELNRRAQGRYTCAQENELANAQRPDLFVQAPSVTHSVPIELKLLDKGWSGPDLCERLRNQLAGDYLREGQGRAGVFLLIWTGTATNRRWQIENQTVGLAKLEGALTDYWNKISQEFENVDAVSVLVVDLTMRLSKSNG